MGEQLSENVSEHVNEQLSEFVNEQFTDKKVTCDGCKYGILNQLGHMDKGGCLYSPSSDEESDLKNK